MPPRLNKGALSIAESHPQLTPQWHPSKNGALFPSHFSAGSEQRVWWQCEKGHEWEAVVNSRTRIKGRGCPYCAGFLPVIGLTDLASTYPQLMHEWHPIKNETVAPTQVTAGSNRRVWWQCEKGHEWEARINNRTLYRNGCPVCAQVQRAQSRRNTLKKKKDAQVQSIDPSNASKNPLC